MSLTPGQSLGPYQIVAELGRGGMGEVYRAHDPRLRRDVAIKVLPPAFATDDERLRRFEQEAHATAALNHPNILAVHDVGRAESTAYVVAELLDGQTLRDAIGAGPLPVRKVVNYAAQVANGLAAAHEKGIVHRDLKPENLFVTADERIKILDFGLAKVSESGVAVGETRLAGTEPGVVLGTFGYMAPEQVRGQAVDHRADIFSFGAVLFELLTGSRAFGGDTAADAMTAILKESPPDLADSGRAIPPPLARLVDRCLEKNPARRFQSASDLAFALQTLGSETGSGSRIGPPIADLPKERGGRLWLIAGAALIVGAAVTAAAFWQFTPRPAPPPFLEFDVPPPPGHVTEVTSALSPDAARLSYVVRDSSRRSQLWLRTFETGKSAPITGTDDARNPFWSPDGESIGFFAGGRLRAVNLSTGRVRVICDAPGGRPAGTWNRNGVIVFASEIGVALKRVEARGGEPVAFAMTGFRPHFLPDGRHFVFHGGTEGLQVGDLESTAITRIGPGRDAAYSDGYLLFVRGSELIAQPFDAASLSLSGQPAVIADVGRYPASTGPNYTAAGGLIAIRRQPERESRLVWYARDGTRLSEIAGGGSWHNPSLSPDDAHIAVARDEQQGTAADIWIVDVAKGTARALSADVDIEQAPIWSEDGRRVIFRSSATADPVSPGKVLDKALDGADVVTVSDIVRGTFSAFTPDGRSLLAFTLVDGNRDILIYPREGGGPPSPFARTTFNETQPAIAPDGRWLAYVSNELGQTDIFIQAFPGGGRKIHVTADTGGGIQPRWGRDGRELYFLAVDRRLAVVAVDLAGDGLRLGRPQPLFPTTALLEPGIGTRASFDITRDGKRFIVAEPPGGELTGEAPVTIFVNWRSAVARGVRPAAEGER